MTRQFCLLSMTTGYLLLAACVTVNVYFPAAAAESAADQFIRDVYGRDRATDPSAPADMGDGMPQSSLQEPPLWIAVLNRMVPEVQAQQPDINISTPGINQLRSAMSARHEQLKPFYDSGALGMEPNGQIALRDEAAVPLRDRNTVRTLIADENRDRQTLYREIARANNHPEWEPDIRNIFALRWVANAPSGWWYRNQQGQWQQK